MQTFLKHSVDKIAKYQHSNLPNFNKILPTKVVLHFFLIDSSLKINLISLI